MTWFKVDDSFAFHSKVVAAGTALTLWVRAGSWCAQQLSDGFVPDHMVTVLGTTKAAQRLVSVGMWDRVDGGYAFHDWADYQPTKAEVEHKRTVRAEAGARGGRASGLSRSGSKRPATTQANGEAFASPLLESPENPRPDPTRPTEPDGSAQTLVAEWIDHQDDRPPGRVIGQVSKELGIMLKEGIPYADVRAGLAAWHQKGLHPSTLAAVVHETRTAPIRRPRSTTDDRVQQALSLAAQIEAMEAAEHHHAIEGRAS